MNYILNTINKQIILNETEYKYILSQMQGGNEFILLKNKGIAIKVNAIMEIYPERSSDTLRDRKKQMTGILHDGEKVIRRFGQWVDYNSAPNDKGEYSPIKLDINYYPEVAVDCVATEEEYKKIISEGLNYYEYLGIKNRALRSGKSNLKKIL